MAKPKINPWDKREDESSKAYAAFWAYLKLGTERSVEEAAKTIQKSPGVLNRWARRFDWKKRAEAWDEEEIKTAMGDYRKEIRQMRKRHAAAARFIMQKALVAFKNMPEEELRSTDIIKAIVEGAKLERISLGDVGEVIEERDGGKAENPVQFYLPSNGRDNLSDDPLEE